MMCAICQDAAKRPVKTDCGHQFCLGCLDSWARVKNPGVLQSRARDCAIKCPLCRNDLGAWRYAALSVERAALSEHERALTRFLTEDCENQTGAARSGSAAALLEVLASDIDDSFSILDALLDPTVSSSNLIRSTMSSIGRKVATNASCSDAATALAHVTAAIARKHAAATAQGELHLEGYSPYGREDELTRIAAIAGACLENPGAAEARRAACEALEKLIPNVHVSRVFVTDSVQRYANGDVRERVTATRSRADLVAAAAAVAERALSGAAGPSSTSSRVLTALVQCARDGKTRAPALRALAATLTNVSSAHLMVETERLLAARRHVQRQVYERMRRAHCETDTDFRFALIDALGDWGVIRGLLEADEAVASTLILFLCSPPAWISDTAPAAKHVGVAAGRAALDAGCAAPLLRLAARRDPKALSAFLSALSMGTAAHVSTLLREHGATLVEAVRGALLNPNEDEGGPPRTTRRAAAMDAVTNLARAIYAGPDACVSGVTLRAGDRLADAVDAWGLFTAVAYAAESEQGALARFPLDENSGDILAQAAAAVFHRAKRALAERVRLRKEKSEQGWLQRFSAQQRASTGSSAQAARDEARALVAAGKALSGTRGNSGSAVVDAPKVALVRIGDGGDLRLAPITGRSAIKLPQMTRARVAAC